MGIELTPWEEQLAKGSMTAYWILLVLALLVVIVGLVMALDNYLLAFDQSLNQFHALRGLAWNIATYTAARALMWIADGSRPR